MKEWTYITNDDNTARYTLGQLGQRMLAFVGINPSTARPDDLDRTVTRVKGFSEMLGYDGWIMLNVYPQRATDPGDMHERMNTEIHQENLRQISRLASTHPQLDICAAWGTEIDRRPYLIQCLDGIVNAFGNDRQWFHLHYLTKAGHPRHPLYLPGNAQPQPFDVLQYISAIK